jgi:uncharacterized membrane protein YeaQ/YmgE (transglycosylase-associated protein family)
MGLLAWIVVGLLAGGIARIVTGAEKRGCLLTIAIGIIGAMIGGAIASAAFDGEGIGHFGFRSIAIAALGAIVFLLVLQALGLISSRRR